MDQSYGEKIEDIENRTSEERNCSESYSCVEDQMYFFSLSLPFVI
jgi:hypothetical protein